MFKMSNLKVDEIAKLLNVSTFEKRSKLTLSINANSVIVTYL